MGHRSKGKWTSFPMILDSMLMIKWRQRHDWPKFHIVLDEFLSNSCSTKCELTVNKFHIQVNVTGADANCGCNTNLKSEFNIAVLSVNRYSTDKEDHSYIITFFSTCFIMPLGLIFYCYGRLLRKLQKVSKDEKVAHLSHFFPSTLFMALHFCEIHFSYLITLKWLCHTLMNIILFS